ncbi:hypothetical protein M422DRAFT_247807 [Sphaerobolus stellatus SS14]|nr:hypothetical protein M422DRAFT_247807 [Sphaerobolus stellatus SS14]
MANDGLQFRVQWTLEDVTWEPLSGVKELEVLDWDDNNGYLITEEVDISDWLSQITTDVMCQAFM